MATRDSRTGARQGTLARTLQAGLDCARPWLMVAGRVLLASIFIVSGVRKVFQFDLFVDYMIAFSVPAPRALLPLAAALEIVAGTMLALGIQVRWAAAALFLETWLLNSIFHNFWTYPDAQQQAQLNLFLFHLTTMGGMLYVLACGGGPVSVRSGDRESASVSGRETQSRLSREQAARHPT